MSYGSVSAMVRWLDREEIAAARERRYRNRMRRLKPKDRQFVRVLRHVLEDVQGPENLQREKIMKALKIKDRMYRQYIFSLPKNLV